MRAVISVMGIDCTGIIAKVSGCLYKHGVNILDINQTIMQNIFTMVMLVEFPEGSAEYNNVMSELDVNRQDYILNHIRDWQVFITCCEPSTVLRMYDGKTFEIKNGQVI